jgi:hypothetical protein
MTPKYDIGVTPNSQPSHISYSWNDDLMDQLMICFQYRKVFLLKGLSQLFTRGDVVKKPNEHTAIADLPEYDK